MNRQQIETTPAGPELDALVAEAQGIDYPLGYAIPQYSNDIDKAWELVEELLKSGWRCVITREDGARGGKGQATPEAITRAYLMAKLEEE